MSVDIERLIAQFGGPSELADALNRLFPEDPVSRAAIYKWRERGSMPLSQLNRVSQLAASQGRSFDIQSFFLAARPAWPAHGAHQIWRTSVCIRHHLA